jgi:hypothetical protein
MASQYLIPAFPGLFPKSRGEDDIIEEHPEIQQPKPVD